MKIRGILLILLCALIFCACDTQIPPTAAPIEQNAEDAPLSQPDIGQRRISFVAAGDNLIHGNIYIDARARCEDREREFDFLPMYSAIADIIAEADISFINQESPIAGSNFRYSGYPHFNTPAEMGHTLVELGFDVINLANNHMLDKGEAGLAHSIEFWGEQEVLSVGGYTKENYNEPRIIECEGVRIAFLAYTDWTNDLYLSSKSQYFIPYTDDDLISSQIKAAKKSADLVFVSIHWGNEDEKKENDEQRRVAQLMCESGADVIIGTHPHVLQSVEWLSGQDGQKTLVAYSLGNLMSTMQYGRNLVSCLLSFDIVLDSDGIRIEAPQMIPVVTQYTMKDHSYDWLVKDIDLYLLQDYTEELASAHGCRVLDSDFSLEWAKGYVRERIAPEYLPAWLK